MERKNRRTHARAPVNLDVAVGLQPDFESLVLQEPHPRPFRRLAQHVLVDLAEVRDRLKNSPDASPGIVSTIMVVYIPLHYAECATNGLDVAGIGKHGAGTHWRACWDLTKRCAPSVNNS